MTFKGRRHSRLVRVLRLALPISAASIVAFYALTFRQAKMTASTT